MFSAENPTTRTRAVRLAVKLGASGETARAAVADAATRLPADERAPLAAAFGVTETAEEEEVFTGVPLMSAPPLLPPIQTTPELVVELKDVQRTGDPEAFERIMAAIVEFSHHDRDAMAADLKADFEPTAWDFFRQISYVPDDAGWLLFWAAALIGEHADQKPSSAGPVSSWAWTRSARCSKASWMMPAPPRFHDRPAAPARPPVPAARHGDPVAGRRG